MQSKHKSAYWARACFMTNGHNLPMGRTAKDGPPHYLREWREFRELTQDQLAERANIDRTAISKIEKGLRPLMQDRLPAFAKALKIEVAQLYSPPADTGAPIVDVTKNASNDESVATRKGEGLDFLPGRPTGVRDLPIRGHTKAGETGFFVDQGQTWGFAMRPESLRGVPEAYAVRVHDDSMEPRYRAGLILQVDPFRRPNPGDNVIIQLNDGQAFVKEYVRKTDKNWQFLQLNPKGPVEYPSTKVKSVHLVVGVDYLER